MYLVCYRPSSDACAIAPGSCLSKWTGVDVDGVIANAGIIATECPTTLNNSTTHRLCVLRCTVRDHIQPPVPSSLAAFTSLAMPVEVVD